MSKPRLPAIVACDFCPGRFKPERWNQRTCPECADRGKPDQSRPQPTGRPADPFELAALLDRHGRGGSHA